MRTIGSTRTRSAGARRMLHVTPYVASDEWLIAPGPGLRSARESFHSDVVVDLDTLPGGHRGGELGLGQSAEQRNASADRLERGRGGRAGRHGRFVWHLNAASDDERVEIIDPTPRQTAS